MCPAGGEQRPLLHRSADLFRGAEQFARHCAACHGILGRGDGPGASLLSPTARDFGKVQFRLVSTGNAVPSDADLASVIRRGMPGSAMPGFVFLGEPDVWNLAAYVRQLAQEGLARDLVRAELAAGFQLSENEAERRAVAALTPRDPLDPGPPAPEDPTTLARGKELYGQKCSSCHGLDGRGVPDPKRTDEGDFVEARDFTAGILKGSTFHEDLMWRVLAGMPGTSMGPTRVAAREDAAALVAFVRSLLPAGAESRLVQERVVVRAVRVTAVPALATDAAWRQATELSVALAPFWWSADAATRVSIAALHDGERLALRLRWEDASCDDRPLTASGFSDGAALQWSDQAEPPLSGMGSPEHPVNLWHWRAFRWQDVQGILDLVGTPPHGGKGNGRTDAPIYAPARVVVPPPAARAEADIVEGSGRPPHARLSQVDVAPLWADGQWGVVFTRSLAARNPRELAFAAGATVQVAIAVWNGAARGRGRGKAISIWHGLELAR